MKSPGNDPRIDAYISGSEDFARPILQHLRHAIHAACPEVQETIKWGIPHFEYKDAILCSMASFKRHCAFGFWLGATMADPDRILLKVGKTGMGQLGKITSLEELPSGKILNAYIREAMRLNEAGVRKGRPAPSPEEEAAVPDDFMNLLRKHKKALAVFTAFSRYNRKEYVTWIEEARTEATRARRMATAVEWIAEGKPRNWKYM